MANQVKESHKTLWIVLSAVLAVFVIAALCVDGFATKQVSEQLHKLSMQDNLTLEWSDLDVRLIHGSFSVDDLMVELTVPENDSIKNDSAFIRMTIPYLYAGHIHWIKAARQRILHLDRITVERPVLTARSAKDVLDALAEQPKDTAVQNPLQGVRVDRFKLKDAAGDITNCNDKLHLGIDSLNITLRDLSFNFADTTFGICDSLYLLTASNMLFCSEDGLTKATVDRFYTADAGPIRLGGINGGNTDKKAEHAHRMGNIAATWMQFSMRDIHTSPVNIIRTAMNKELKLDSLLISGNSMEIYRDHQFAPKEKYPMPQEDMMKSEVPFLIDHMLIDVDKFVISLTENGKDVGTLAFTHNNIHMSNITNAQGSVVKTVVTNRLSDGGSVKMGMDMTVNPACSFTFHQEMTKTHGSTLAALTVPVMGVAIGADIHSLRLDCKGDKHSLQGKFCMQYDSLTLHVEENTPIEDLAKTAGIVNLFAPVVLQKQNPRHADQPAESFDVQGKRDPWKPFPFYFMDPITEGIMKTILPLSMAESVLKSQQKAAQKKGK